MGKWGLNRYRSKRKPNFLTVKKEVKMVKNSIAAEICGRPFKRLNICGVEIRRNSKKKVDLSEREIFGFINCLMGIRAEELKALEGKDE